MPIPMTTSCSDLASVPMIVNEMIWARYRCLAGCLMQLVSNTKVNLLPPQLVFNQGTLWLE